jgi:hypothetical protein
VRYDAREDKRRLYRRITVGPEERMRTAAQRIAMLDAAATDEQDLQLFRPVPTALELQHRHDRAFDVEAVTRQFFEEYKTLFRAMQAELDAQTDDAAWAHDYAQQFLNRLMFMYFVQRKRWLGDDNDFLTTFWRAYRRSGRPEDTFYSDWLSVLFFEAFNNRFHGGHTHFPDDIKEALHMAPYLNGGLFRRNELDTRHSPRIEDRLFQQAYEFTERYNFTIAEDSPLDQEVAVDPEMIGKVYESLVNVSAEADERGDAGIFYTPRTEIDLMCRLALVDNLANHLGAEQKNLLYEVVFALEPDEKDEADRRVEQAGLWQALAERLQATTVVDPACGSGSFLVGMLHILDDLQARAQGRKGIHEDPYDRKRRIIGQSLYGVDVMEWACHVAELRLWLALIIDAEIDTTAAHVRNEPLLPHFSFNIRCGDSLVQEVGGVNLAHIKGSKQIPSSLKGKITTHKKEKLKFYANDPECAYRSLDAAKAEELRLFRELLVGQEGAIAGEIKQLQCRIQNPKAGQIRLDGSVDVQPQMELQAARWQEEIDDLELARQRIAGAIDALRNAAHVPFVWDIAFVEISEREQRDQRGFDIVVGNPPYVRQEDISDPTMPREAVNPATKKAYKARLARSVHQAYPRHFGYSAKSGSVSNAISGKSDLYIYFYYHGLSLLNTKGSFCFITSNSWLDVGYGAGLQEFLLRHSHVKLVLDNELRRSFADADVNTVIVLLSAPDDRNDAGLDRRMRFVMFTAPYEAMIHPVIFQELEEATDRETTPDYRIHALCQAEALTAGSDTAPDATGTHGPLIRVGQYGGDKWGGKYLRAPDIYWEILERAGDRLVRLGDIADVRRGVTTGANEFFFLRLVSDAGADPAIVQAGDRSEHQIERRFVEMPVITKARELARPLIDPSVLEHRLFNATEELRDEDRLARAYVEWGEAQPREFHRRATCAQRARSRPWYVIGERGTPDLVIPIGHKRRPVLGIVDGTLVGDNLVEVRYHDGIDRVITGVSVFSVFTMLQYELLGRANFGQGLLKTQTYELDELLVLDPRRLSTDCSQNLLRAFDAIAQRPPYMVYDEVTQLDRLAFEMAVLGALGVEDDRTASALLASLSDSVCRVVWQRMAKTDNSREARQTYDEWLASGEPFGDCLAEED